METLWSNATVWWSEGEIVKRNCLIDRCVSIVGSTWLSLNRAIHLRQIETPIMTPEDQLKGHVVSGFDLIGHDHGYLRPETTAGAYSVMSRMFPMMSQLKKNLPICLWQVGKSFRDEAKPDTMRATKLRLREFWQLEFELFTAEGTKCDYLKPVCDELCRVFGGSIIECSKDQLPHYSSRTLDWQVDGLEVAGCSQRTDWPYGMVFEVSIGLDRLTAISS
jgi:hypothetical protein